MNYSEKSVEQLVYDLREQYGEVVLLESQMKEHPSSERTYIASAPVAVLRYENGKATLSEDGKETDLGTDPWKAMSEFRLRYKDWMFGYFGYDLKNSLEDLRSGNPAKGNFPDLYMMVPGFLAEVRTDGALRTIRETLQRETSVPFTHNSVSLGRPLHVSKERYAEKVEQALSSIREGDYYEINLSHVLEFEMQGDPLDLYKRMKERAPVPFGSFLTFNGTSICCMSPERFLKKEGDKVLSQPIKGTIANSGVDDDSVLKERLLSEKNKAENLMIVDLVRNDLNRVSVPGSVKVEQLFEVQSFGTVHQMVSTIRSLALPGCDEIDVIKACFPMGSMTGAPKISAMRSIEELEDHKRGVYSGAIGYIDPEGNFDLNVVIRTALIDSGKLYYAVGGAITSDSDPGEEWEETWVKARALTDVV